MTKIYSDKTAKKHLRDRTIDIDSEMEELRFQMEQLEQVKRIAEKHGLRPVSGEDLKKGMVVHLDPLWSDDQKLRVFPFAPYKITRKVKSRAYSGSHPPDYVISVDAIDHSDGLGNRLDIRKEEWFWTPIED